jgi:hypothetical protein
MIQVILELSQSEQSGVYRSLFLHYDPRYAERVMDRSDTHSLMKQLLLSHECCLSAVAFLTYFSMRHVFASCMIVIKHCLFT